MTESKSKEKTKTGLTIRGQLSLVTLSVIVVLILFGLFVIYSVNRIKNINSNFALILSMDDCIERMTDSQSTFILNESSKKEFFVDPNVSSVLTFEGYSNKLNNLFQEFSNNRQVKKLINQQRIDSLGILAIEYKSLFDSLLVLTQEKGYKDYGLIGKMQVAAHELENTISGIDNNILHVSLLQLRRDEKDFLLYKDPNYFERLKRDASEFNSLIDTTMNDPIVKAELNLQIARYLNLLEKIKVLDANIGFTSSIGILTALDEKEILITNLNESFIQTFSTYQSDEIKSVKLRFLIVVVIIIISFSLIIRKITNNISSAFNNIKKALQSFALGIIPENLSEEKSSHEIRNITRLLNQIISGFRNSIQFADNLKDGRFDQPFEPLSEKDELGNTLLNMKNELIEAQQQREEQQKEEKTQAWINKGTAEFAEVLNQNYKNTEEFTYSIINKLIKYLDANQAGFFVINTENEEEPYLKLASAIAYDRRKFVDDRIAIGEGFVGSSVVENNIFYRTEIPEDYISITSGMGGSNPRVLLIIPLVLDSEIYGAIEIASFKEFEDFQIEFVKTVSESITITMSSVKSKEETQKLLDQTQTQAEQIIQAEEEMRQNLEEMQATQEESARREEKLMEELDEANKTINKLNNRLSELTKNIED